MTSELNELELALLRETLRRPQGMPVWLLTTKIGFSIKEIAFAYRRLRDLGFLGEKDGNIRILTMGRNWALANQDKFAFSGTKTWRDVPSRFHASKIAPFSPYAPRVSGLDKSKFRFGRYGKR